MYGQAVNARSTSARAPEGRRVLELYLVRHAVAMERDPVVWPVDAGRPLTTQGAARFRRAARGLRLLVPHVDRVLSSPYARAWATARILHEETGWPEPESCLPLTSPDYEGVLAAIAKRPGLRAVGLVGHEPHLSGLAAWLLAGAGPPVTIEMKKGAVAHIEVGAPTPGTAAVLRWLLPPRVLRRLA
ncbi:MAG: histidine phosphatase family protein [Dehalococcoidia bacterium]